MKTVELGDVLPKDALKQLATVATELQDRQIDTYATYREKVKAILEPHRAYAEKRGMDIGYLYYAIEYVFSKKGLKIPS